MKLFKQHPNTRTSDGFTLIEVLVAVGIFTSSLAGLLLMVGTGIGNVNVAKDRLVANYLAQEGIELMRYKRDYFTQISNDPQTGWTNFQSFVLNCTIVNSCGVSALHPTSTPVSCIGNANCAIMEDAHTGTYALYGDPEAASWTPTIYRRYVYVKTATNNTNDSYIIYSIVTWSVGTGSYTTTMSETIYNWQ